MRMMFRQNPVPVNEVMISWMYNKQGLTEIIYNVQSAVNTISNLICAIKLFQNPYRLILNYQK